MGPRLTKTPQSQRSGTLEDLDSLLETAGSWDLLLLDKYDIPVY